MIEALQCALPHGVPSAAMRSLPSCVPDGCNRRVACPALRESAQPLVLLCGNTRTSGFCVHVFVGCRRQWVLEALL